MASICFLLHFFNHWVENSSDLWYSNFAQDDNFGMFVGQNWSKTSKVIIRNVSLRATSILFENAENPQTGLAYSLVEKFSTNANVRCAFSPASQPLVLFVTMSFRIMLFLTFTIACVFTQFIL